MLSHLRTIVKAGLRFPLALNMAAAADHEPDVAIELLCEMLSRQLHRHWHELTKERGKQEYALEVWASAKLRSEQEHLQLVDKAWASVAESIKEAKAKRATDIKRVTKRALDLMTFKVKPVSRKKARVQK